MRVILVGLVVLGLGVGWGQDVVGDAGKGPAEPAPMVRKLGGGVSPPVVLFAPTPQFSKEARKAKQGGAVLVYLQVDTTGAPTHVRVLRGVGYGLDEKAVEAVKQYKFKPAMENGKPVTVEMNVSVNFQIYDKAGS